MRGILSGRRILVVEDEMLVLMNIEMTLHDLGCSTISAAATVTDALALLATHRFDAALLDVNLGGKKSYPVADVLRKRGIPFAFSTGYGDHGDRADLNEVPLLKKPYVPADIEAMLTRLLPGEAFPAAA